MPKKLFSLLCLPATKSSRQVIKKFPFPINLTEGTYTDLELVFQKGAAKALYKGVDMSTFSFVWLTSDWASRDLAYALRLYFENTKTPHSTVEKSPSKVTDAMAFALNNLPIPDTVFVSRVNSKKSIPLIEQVCGYPLVIKDIKGSKGKHSQYVQSTKELLEKMRALPKNKKFLFQKYIPNEYDWGIMVANGVVVAGEKTYSANDKTKHTIFNRTEESFVDVSRIPQEIKDMAVQASAALKLLWSRVDIIIDTTTNLPYILEVNRYPGITADSSEVAGAYTFLSSYISPLHHIQKSEIAQEFV